MCRGKTIGNNDGTHSLILMDGGGDLHHNIVLPAGVMQITDGKHLVDIQTGRDNLVAECPGSFGDPTANTSDVPILTDTNAGVRNQIMLRRNWAPSDWTDNSGHLQFVGNVGGMWLAQDLFGKDGVHPGLTMPDDGTNTTGSGLPCQWTGSAWQPSDDSSTFQ